jgi:Putative effector of murein hydrolase LrgA
MVVKQFFIVLSALFLGYALSSILNIPIPANVLGFLILLTALCLGIIKVQHVDKICDFIINYLALFFVVPTVGVMVYFGLIGKQFLHILLPLSASILMGFFTAAKVTELFIRLEEKKRLSSGDHDSGGGENE